MSKILKLLLCFLALIVAFMVMPLWPHNTSTTSRYDGLTVTLFRKHYPFDIEDGGTGQYLDTRMCIDAANVCARSPGWFYTYPKENPDAPWLELCDPKTHSSRFFNRDTGMELKCGNCDIEALRCPKPSQTGRWFDNGNHSAELVGYAKENLSTIRTFSYDAAGVTMSEFPSLKGVAYGAGEVISEWFYGDESAMVWIQCDKKKCDAYRVDFKTGQSTREATPCHYGDLLTFVLVGDRPEIRVDSEAKSDEICRDARGKPAYPLAPETERWHSQPIDAVADAPVETPQLPETTPAKPSEVP